jgi:glyoxylase-like metal-dependent hydrolase (beta-lactamase superfamily II)
MAFSIETGANRDVRRHCARPGRSHDRGLHDPRPAVRQRRHAGWEALFPGEIPAAAEKVLPQLLTAGTLDLEGNELRVIRIGQADTAQSTVLHVPSLAAVVTGDLAYNGVHMMTAETGEPERAQWITNLDEVAALQPAVVVAGHKKVSNGNDPKIITESQQYLRDFTRIAAGETTTAGIVAQMAELYPDWENLRTLWHSARTAIARKNG